MTPSRSTRTVSPYVSSAWWIGGIFRTVRKQDAGYVQQRHEGLTIQRRYSRWGLRSGVCKFLASGRVWRKIERERNSLNGEPCRGLREGLDRAVRIVGGAGRTRCRRAFQPYGGKILARASIHGDDASSYLTCQRCVIQLQHHNFSDRFAETTYMRTIEKADIEANRLAKDIASGVRWEINRRGITG